MSIAECPSPVASKEATAGRAAGGLKVLLLARSLGFGGAERQLIYLADGLARRGHNLTIATFYAGGAFDDACAQQGIERLVIGKSGRWDLGGFACRMLKALVARQPDVIYSFLPVPNLLAAVARAVVCPDAALVWGLRGTPLQHARYDWLERLAIRLERLASRAPDLVIANSRAGFIWARGPDFNARQVAMVANGIDIDAFYPASAKQRKTARAAIGCAETALLVAVVGRLDPMKDHATFLKAFTTAARSRPNLRAAIAGDGRPSAAAELRRFANELGVADRVIWTGARRQVIDIYHAADALCLPSAFGEGFPNVIGEAMACGLPCIVTAVGDSASLVGDTGVVVPPSDPAALARAMLDHIKPPGTSTLGGPKARQRIAEYFGLEAMVSATERSLLEIAAEHRRTRKRRTSC